MAVTLFYRCLLTHQRVIAKPIPPNSTVKPGIPLTMVTHVPMAPETTNPQTDNETWTSLLISFVYVSDLFLELSKWFLSSDMVVLF